MVSSETNLDLHERTSKHEFGNTEMVDEDREEKTNPMPLVPPVTSAVIPLRDHLWLLKPAIKLLRSSGFG
jgi:hypothetical protein